MAPDHGDVEVAARKFLRWPEPRLGPRALKLLRRVGLRMGFDVVRTDYYSPILDTRTLPAEHWDLAAPMPGLELDLDAQLELIERELLPFVREFRPPVEPQADPATLHLDNPWYGPMDSHLLYAFVRRGTPRRVLELGSGYSTLVIERALAANRAGAGSGPPHEPPRHDVVDPFPSPLIDSICDSLTVHRISAAAAPRQLFEALGAGDLLFVDTSHVLKPGSEVIRLVLEVLPALRSGVTVHFHDIFRPFEYPRIFYDRFNVHWQEQYLLQGFLAYNPHFRVLCSNQALWRLRRERVRPMFEGLREGMQPGGFWFTKV